MNNRQRRALELVDKYKEFAKKRRFKKAFKKSISSAAGQSFFHRLVNKYRRK